MVSSYQAMLSFLSMIALLVGIFFISNSMSTAVSERRKEIGILRALGSTRLNVLGLFIAEAAMMGVVGAGIGVWLGRIVASLLVTMVSRSMSIQYLTHVEVAQLHFGIAEILHGVLIGTGAAILAALVPSYKASTISPLLAMRGQEPENSLRKNQRGHSILILGCLMSAYFLLSSFFKIGQKSPLLESMTEIASVVGPALIAPTVVAWMMNLLHSLKLGAV